MKSVLLPQASLPPEYSFDTGENFIGPTMISGLTLPGLDLPEGFEPSATALHPHTEARVELLKQANLTRWHALWAAARASFREAGSDFRKANRRAGRIGERLAKTASPRTIRLLVLTLTAVAALACEYVLSAPLIGPVFGFEPDSWPSRCLGAIILCCTVGMKFPVEWALHKLTELISGRKNMQTATVLLKCALVCGIVLGNFVLVYDLAPLRELAGAVLNSVAEPAALDAGETASSTDDSNVQKADDSKAQKAAGLVIGLVSVLDGLILCLAVDRIGRRAFRHWALKRKLDRYRKQRTTAMNRIRTARRQVKHWQFIWSTREERVKAITDAMRAREECLRSPKMPEVPASVPTPVEWVEQTLRTQHQQLPYVN